jgi:hypothetical protein
MSADGDITPAPPVARPRWIRKAAAISAAAGLIVAIIFGGRAQRLGDPVATTAAGVTTSPADSAEVVDARADSAVH